MSADEPAPPTPRRSLVGALARRAGWGLADQVLSSLTNFAIGFVAARAYSPAGLGVFALVFATYLIFLNAVRQLAVEPLLIRYSGGDQGRWRGAAQDMTGLAVTFGLAGSFVCLAIGLVVSGQVGLSLVALAIVLPGLLLQDAWRFAFFARALGRSAFFNDLVWAIVLVPVLGAVLATGTIALPVLIIAWGAAANVAALAGVFQAGFRPALGRSLSWIREHRDLAPAMTADTLAGLLLSQASQFAIATVAGLGTVGALRAGQLLLGPVLVAYQGIQLVVVPEGAALLQRSRRALWRACLAYGSGLSAAVIVYAILLLAIPDEIGRALLKQNWDGAHLVLPALTAALVVTFFYTAAATGLRVLADAGAILRYGVVSSLAQFVFSVVGAAVGGAPGSALGNGLGSLIGATAAWRRLGARLRGGADPASAAAPPLPVDSGG